MSGRADHHVDDVDEFDCCGKPPRSLIGRRIAIHAGARAVRVAEVRALIRNLRGGPSIERPCLHADKALPLLERVLDGMRQRSAPMFGGDEPDPFRLPLSAIVCTAVLGAPMPGYECAREFGIPAGNDSDRGGTFNWGWPMLQVEPVIPPVPARGAQGFWDWSGP